MSKKASATVEHSITSEVELNGLERLLLLAVLPKEGSLMTVRVLHELRMVLGLSDDELAILRKNEQGQSTYEDLAALPAKAVPVGPAARELIVAGLKQLDEAQGVTEQHLGLYDAFPLGEP